jgi:hypothetical protein
MSNFEGSPLNEDKLRWHEFEMSEDLKRIEEGSTPDEIAWAHNFVAKVHKNNQLFKDQVGNGILARYGVEDDDQLPVAGLIEMAEKHAEWMREHPIHD